MSFRAILRSFQRDSLHFRVFHQPKQNICLTRAIFVENLFDVVVIRFVFFADPKEIRIDLNHIVFDILPVAAPNGIITFLEQRDFFFCVHESLPRSQDHRPGNIELLVSPTRQFKIQYSRDMLVLPKDIGIVKVSWQKHLLFVSG